MGETEPEQPIDEGPDSEPIVQGEHVSTPPDAITGQIEKTASAAGNTCLRPAAVFKTEEGDFPAGLKQVEAQPTDKPGIFELKLQSYNNRKVLISGVFLMGALGVGVWMAKNPTQRRKMSARASSYFRRK